MKAPARGEAFAGFSEQGFRFLKRLKQNNDREWFRERKQDYLEQVEEPMKRLVVAVSSACCARGLPLHPKERAPVMRVYRDIRFSKDKRPFKTHVAAELRRSFADSECLLYIHISPQESFLGAGVWQADKDLLHAWRETMIRNPDAFERMLAALKRGNLALSTEHALAGMPRGLQNYAAEPIGPWLKLTSFILHRSLTPEDCLSPGLVDTVVDFAMAAKPLFEYAWAVEAGSSSATRRRVRESEVV